MNEVKVTPTFNIIIIIIIKFRICLRVVENIFCSNNNFKNI
jgi:hypothetical protein